MKQADEKAPDYVIPSEEPMSPSAHHCAWKLREARKFRVFNKGLTYFHGSPPCRLGGTPQGSPSRRRAGLNEVVTRRNAALKAKNLAASHRREGSR
jgi:hypothetical protein